MSGLRWWRVHLHYYAAGGRYYETTIDVRAATAEAAIADLRVQCADDMTLDFRGAIAEPTEGPKGRP